MRATTYPAVELDPHHTHRCDRGRRGDRNGGGRAFRVRDVLRGETYAWKGGGNYVTRPRPRPRPCVRIEDGSPPLPDRPIPAQATLAPDRTGTWTRSPTRCTKAFFDPTPTDRRLPRPDREARLHPRPGREHVWVLQLYPSRCDDATTWPTTRACNRPRHARDEVPWRRRTRGCAITELIANHTSDEHPWFQARRAPAGSPTRDYYV